MEKHGQLVRTWNGYQRLCCVWCMCRNGFTPQEALGAVLVAGVFLIISLVIRAWLINSIQKSLKLGIGAGIGLFLAIIGLQIMEVVVDNPVTLVQLGNLSDPIVLLGCATFIAIIVLDKMNVKGNIIIGILVFSIIAWATGLAKFNGIVSSPPPMTYLFEFDLSAAMTAGMSTVILLYYLLTFLILRELLHQLLTLLVRL